MKQHVSQPLLPVARAEGVWLFDPEGRRYLDATSSWWVNLFGHQHPDIKAALADQLDRLEHVMLAGCTHAPVVELSERLAALTGLGHAFYASDGASAVEIALKMSAHYWRNRGRPEKSRFVGLEQAYHGETVGALSVTDMALFRSAYAPLVRLSDTVPSPDARRAEPGVGALEHARHCALALEQYLKAQHRQTAALVLEPLVQCAAGMGSMFAHQQAGIRPDFICLSKGLTGGFLPLSAVLTTDEVFDAFYDDETARAFLHSHSYTGNPLACRAALATLDLFERDDVLARNRGTAQRLNTLAQPLARHRKVLRSRHIGMIWAFDVATDDATFARRFHAAALERGVLLRPIGNTLYFMPPYVIDDAASQCLVEGTLGALDACV
jgi:adenosylmethionine-8-amino-7-oxononanoate aminotransferase